MNNDHKLEIARQELYNCLHTTTNSKTFISDIEILQPASPTYILQPSSSNTTADNNEEEWEEFEELYLDTTDTTDVQTFPVDDDANEQPCTALRIDFGRSNDFYGRIIIYSLEVWGLEVDT